MVTYVSISKNNRIEWAKAFRKIQDTLKEKVSENTLTFQVNMPCDFAEIGNEPKRTTVLYYFFSIVNDYFSNTPESERQIVQFKISLHIKDRIDPSLLESIKNDISKQSTAYPSISRISVLLSFSKSVELRIASNSRIGWTEAYKQIFPWINNDKNSILKINLPKRIQFSVPYNVDSNDVTQVRYYFPLRSFLKRKSIQTAIKFTCDHLEDLFRIEQLLSFSSSYFHEYAIETNHTVANSIKYVRQKKTLLDTEASDILPLLEIPKDVSQKNKLLEEATNAYKRSLFSLGQGRNIYQGDNENSITRQNKQDLINELYLELFTSEESSLDSLSPPKKITDEDINDKYLRHFSVDDRLSILIFFFLLRQYVIDRIALTLCNADGKKRWIWNRSILQKTIMDSKSYGEGLGQLIENAHEHSQGQTAFFGMRLHKASTDVTMSKISKNAETRELLWHQYWLTDSNAYTDNIFNQCDEYGNKKYQDFLEIFVLDDALLNDGVGFGILEAIRKDQEKLKPYCFPKRISDIFELTENDYIEKEPFYIKHYGMRWLMHHINRLHGIVAIYSPAEKDCDDAGSYCYHNYFNEKIEQWAANKNIDRMIFSTEYAILLPISYHVQEDPPIIEQKCANYFMPIRSDILSASYQDISSALNNMQYGPTQEKADLAKQLGNNFLHIATNYSGAFYLSLPRNTFTPVEIEILAKGIFMWVFQFATKNPKAEQLYLAINFHENKDLIYEFIRIYSIFYLKQNKNHYMETVQVALCSDNGSRSEINFILAGKDIGTALLTANNFVYYNADSALEFVPLLRYLVSDNPDKVKGSKSRIKIEQVPLYPFELIPQNDRPESWFLQQVREHINTNIWENRFGCKIPDVRVRLGSKIHIDTFYEAELLFHNMANVKRFAYLIAQDIIANSASDLCSNISYIVGYENYSAILVQEVIELLHAYIPTKKRKKSGPSQQLLWTLDTHSAGTFPVMNVPACKFESRLNKTVNVYTIVPIASTMSTVYKLHESFKRGFDRTMKEDAKGITINFLANYVLLAVGDVFVQESTDVSEIPRKYLAITEKATTEKPEIVPAQNELWKYVTLKPEKQNEIGAKIKYCFAARSKWYDMRSGNINDAEFTSRPLIHADKTSTLFNASFQMKLSKDAQAYYCRKGENNVEYLQPHIDHDIVMPFFRYAHICREENHYQFYFDFKLLAQKHKKEIESWLKRSVKIEENAYNIIVSPLSESNTPFLEMVLKKAFGPNLHFLHIDINNTEKENVRTKFSYISRELRQMQSAYAKVNFFYVDESVYTCKTIDRAAKLLLMLCEQSGIPFEKLCVNGRNFVFKKVILLLNRNAYETAYQWVEKPVEDWVAFIDLQIPPYNMHAGICPGCHVYERFRLLWKRSATNELAAHFAASVDKHTVRTLEEYEDYIIQKIKNDDRVYSAWMQSYYRNSSDISEEEIKKIKVSEQGDVMQRIIAEDQYIRLYTMNKAYRKLIYDESVQISFDGSNVETVKQQIKENILKLICEPFNPKSSAIPHMATNKYNQIMAFNSYLKVISRDHLARNYLIREAIYMILHCIFLILILPISQNDNLESIKEKLNDNKKNRTDGSEIYYSEILEYFDDKKDYYRQILENIRNFDNKSIIHADLQFRIFKIVVHRLSLLHSDFIIKTDVVKQVMDAFEAIQKRKDSSAPSMDDAINLYLASVKTASMSEDDNAMCESLFRLCQDTKEDAANE